MLENEGITPENLKGYSVYRLSYQYCEGAVLGSRLVAGGIQDNLAKRLVKEGKIKSILLKSKLVHISETESCNIQLK